MTKTVAQQTEMDMTLSARESSLVGSAYRVVTRKGGHRTSLQDIADDAGVSKGLLLYHFKSKDGLLLTTMRWALLRTARRIRMRLASASGDAMQVVDALIDALFVGPEQNREFYLLYLDLIEYAAREPSFSELSHVTREIIDGLYAEMVRDGVSREVFDIEDVDDIATLMRAHIDGIFVTWLQEQDWVASYPHYRERCRSGLMRLLGVG